MMVAVIEGKLPAALTENLMGAVRSISPNSSQTAFFTRMCVGVHS